MIYLIGVYIITGMFCYHFLTFQEAKEKATTIGGFVFMLISPIYLGYLLFKNITK